MVLCVSSPVCRTWGESMVNYIQRGFSIPLNIWCNEYRLPACKDLKTFKDLPYITGRSHFFVLLPLNTFCYSLNLCLVSRYKTLFVDKHINIISFPKNYFFLKWTIDKKSKIYSIIWKRFSLVSVTGGQEFQNAF